MKNIVGVVLAGGKSRRMKTDKALIKFHNKTLLENQVNLLSSIFKTVIISANTQEYAFVNKQIVEDIYPNIGPIGGLLSVLKKVETEYIFALSIDIPLVSKDLILYLISKLEDKDIVMPVFKNKYEPTCAIYSTRCIKIIEEQIQNKDFKLINLINKMNTKFIDIDKGKLFYSENLFTNLNTLEDLHNLDT